MCNDYCEKSSNAQKVYLLTLTKWFSEQIFSKSLQDGCTEVRENHKTAQHCVYLNFRKNLERVQSKGRNFDKITQKWGVTILRDKHENWRRGKEKHSQNVFSLFVVSDVFLEERSKAPLIWGPNIRKPTFGRCVGQNGGFPLSHPLGPRQLLWIFHF